MSKILSTLTSHTGRQTMLLFGSQIAMVAVGFGIKTIQTNYLGAEAFGLYAFFGTFTTFTALFFRFGFFSSLQVLLAENKNFQFEKELFGIGFALNLVISGFYVLFIWFFSFFIDDLFSTQIGSILRLIAPLTIIIPTRSLLSALSIGSNRVHIIPIYDTVSKILFLITLMLFAFSDSLSVYLTILFNLVTLIIAFGVVYRQFNPSFTNLKSNFQKVWQKNKDFGFHFYLGSTANQSSFKLDELAISYFINTTVNGFYSLANVIASPMVMGSQALSNSLFKKFNSQEKIPNKVFLYNTAWLIISMITLYFLAEWVVQLLFGEEYFDVSQYAIGLSIAFFFQGLYQPFNFLSAKSEGKAVRNVAITEAVINVTGNIILIPIFGVLGAIYTSIFAKFIHFVGKLYYYKRFLKENNIDG